MNRWFSMLLSLLLLLLLAACGQVEVTPDDAPSPNQNIEVDPGSAEQEEPDKPKNPLSLRKMPLLNSRILVG